ncbi:hypothetical protein HK097_000546 [Rhizophlyctis rosea]|uniref:PEBP-like protein n=1 Tax=Rhizophlyctis rosea TaxID=64517 RepID=A0AAD5SKK6_9FUNG|nr:hypothetical protein HK097_000546 [Rhizophlyctis rosea]
MTTSFARLSQDTCRIACTNAARSLLTPIVPRPRPSTSPCSHRSITPSHTTARHLSRAKPRYLPDLSKRERPLEGVPKNLDHVFEKLLKSQLFHGVIQEFKPKTEIDITFNGNLKVDYGNELRVEDVQKAPVLNWDTKEKGVYAIVMIDPDAPSRADPRMGQYRHWAVINVPEWTLPQARPPIHVPRRGKEWSTYRPPLPKEGSGTHRYAFILFEQRSPRLFSRNEQRRKGNEWVRGHWNVQGWAMWKDMKPIGMNWFTITA